MPLIAGLAVLWFTVIAWATRDQRDAANDGRSIDRYSHAMRVLSRRAPSRASGRVVVVPTPSVTDPAAKRGKTVLDRRRTMLRRLVVASAVSFAGILLGGPWLYIHLGVDAILVTYVVTLRRIALRGAEAARRERREALARREAAHRAAYEARVQATVHVMPERVEHRRAVND